jgi:hypothetical protein
MKGPYIQRNYNISDPGGGVVKSINLLTDEAGRASIYVPSGSGTELGTMTVEVFVSLTGFNPAAMVIYYEIVSE